MREQGPQQAEARLRLLLDSVKDYAIVTLDLAGRIETWNAGAREVFGYRVDEVIGQPFDILFTPEDRAVGTPATELQQALEDGAASDERWLIRKDGSRFFAGGTVSAILDDSGTALGFVKIARDMTELRRYGEGLRRIQDNLEERVAQRTGELAAANVSLEAEVVQRRSGEEPMRSLLRRLVTVQEDERRRIARDLHDHLGQQMTALRLNLDSLKAHPESLGDMDVRLETADRIATQLEADVDFLAWQLRPAGIDELGLAATLQRFIGQWSHQHGIDGEFHWSGRERERLGLEVEINLYRIAQEALNNAYKHAQATRVDIILEKRQENVVLIIEDNGTGFDPALASKGLDGGLGLVSMRERASLAGGTLDIESAPGKGTTIFVRIPLAGSQP